MNNGNGAIATSQAKRSLRAVQLDGERMSWTAQQTSGQWMSSIGSLIDPTCNPYGSEHDGERHEVERQCD